MHIPIRAARLPALALAASLAGCAGFSADGGFSSVEKIARERIGKDAQWTRGDAERQTLDARVAELLNGKTPPAAAPLSADDAVQIAILNNKGLQAAYAELGLAEADLVQAGASRTRASPSAASCAAARSNSSAS